MQEKDTRPKNFLEQEKLIKAIHANDERTLRLMYRENYHKTEKYVLNNSGSIEQAKDNYQEAFITVWENVQKNKFVPRNKTALNGYIYTVAKNKWLDYLKSTRFKKTSSIDSIDYKIEGQDIIADEILDSKMNEKIAKVATTFNNIGDACKKILTVFYYDNKSLREIANELNITEASARNKKYRCLQKLRASVLNSN